MDRYVMYGTMFLCFYVFGDIAEQLLPEKHV